VLDAAICIVWDKERCYYWLSTHRKDSHPDAIKLLITAAMKYASKMGLIFDADGVTTPGSERLYKTIFKMPNEAFQRDRPAGGQYGWRARVARKNEASLKAACGSGCDARRLSAGRSIRA
jgi:hypothetical protein